MKIEKFEDLPIWKESREVYSMVYKFTSNSKFRDFSLRDQMRRSAISISSNIAEGFERGSNKELIQFLYISKGSLGELRSQIYLSRDSNFITEEEFDSLLKECFNLSRNIGNFIKYLKKSEVTKFKHKEK
jgi:four helix bundle protein